MGDPRDIALRSAALEYVRELQRRYDDLVPVRALAEGFQFRGRRVSFGSFYSGIFRPKELEGPAALCLVTAPPKSDRPAPYDDEFDEATDRFTYRFRAARTPTPAARVQAAADNRALVAAHELAVPLISTSAATPPASISRSSQLSSSPSTSAASLSSSKPACRPQTRRQPDSCQAKMYGATQRARRSCAYISTASAYRCSAPTRRAVPCAGCAKRRSCKPPTSSTTADPRGIATVVNGISLCAIHHLAYHRN